MPSLVRSTRLARRWPLAAAVLMAVGFVALTAAPAAAAYHHVMIENYTYGPANLSIDQGDTVTWTNHDSVEHDVVVTRGPTSFRSPMLAQGESWSYTFATPGSYSYICSVHPEMRAAVTAAAAPATSAAPTPSTTPTSTAAPAAKPRASRSPSPTPTTTTTPAAAVEQPAATEPQQVASADLNPLLIVAGVAIAVVVFCLLLLASRPIPASSPDDEGE